MPQYHRAFIEGGTYFFTVISYNRMPILTTNDSRELLRCASRQKQGEAAVWQRRFWEHATWGEEARREGLDKDCGE